jgi:hypothetical protein
MSAIRKPKVEAITPDVNRNQSVERNPLLVATLNDVRLLLIAMWLGAALFFGAAVAPSAFAVLKDSRELAGAIVSRTLAVINVGGFVIALILLLSATARRGSTRRIVFRAEMIALALLLITTGVGQWVITARLERLRVLMNRPVETVALTDPLRIAFGQLHFYSVITLGTGIVAAVIAFFLVARRRNKISIKDDGNV